MASPLLLETVWFDKYKYDDAERKWQEHIAKNSQCSKNNDVTRTVCMQQEEDNVNVKLTTNLEVPVSVKNVESTEEKPIVTSTEPPKEKKQVSKSTIVGEIARARQHIKNSLQSGDNLGISLNSFGDTSELSNRMQRLEEENSQLREMCQDLKSLVQKLDSRVSLLEGKQTSTSSSINPSTPAKPQAQPEDNDDDLDLFGSDEEDEAATKVQEQRLKDYEAKKSKKKAVIAKSSLVLDVKPWDDETDMKKMEIEVRKIQADGLVWGASKLAPLAYGIFKLQIVCVVEDEKISVDWLQETIQEIEECVQSVDIAAFNKL